MRIDATNASKVLGANYRPDAVQRAPRADDGLKYSQPVANVRITPFAKGLSSAMRLQAESAPVDENAVARGKEIIRNCSPPPMSRSTRL